MIKRCLFSSCSPLLQNRISSRRRIFLYKQTVQNSQNVLRPVKASLSWSSRCLCLPLLTRTQSLRALPRASRHQPSLTRPVAPIRHYSRSARTSNNKTTASAPYSGALRQRLRDFLLKPRTLPIPRWVSPSYTSITLSEVCGHASFVLVACSYAVDDFLWLRSMAVLGSGVMLAFTYFHPHGRVLWLPFKWNLLFIIINTYRLSRAYADRYYFCNQLDDDLLALRDEHFYVMDPTDFRKLTQIAHRQSYKKGDLLIAQSERNRYIRLVTDGRLTVYRDGMITYDLERGNFISECGLHSGLLLPDAVESCCSIEVQSDTCHMLSWDRNELMNLLHREPPLRRSLKAALSWDIISKLKAQRQLLLANSQDENDAIIDDPDLWTQKRNEQSVHRYASILHNMLMHPKYMQQRRKELTKYRQIHHISDENHAKALARFGWTVEEFEAGRVPAHVEQHQSMDEDSDDNGAKSEQLLFLDQKGWKWILYDLYKRLFG